MPRLEIDQQAIEVPANATVLEAAKALGIYIPHFCYHKKLSIAANCRMCLVQVEKAPKPLPACATPVTEGMKVFTHSPQAIAAQKGVMEFLLINHPLDCPICDQGGECQLQDLAVGYGASASRYEEAKRVVTNKDLGPLIATDMTRCIHCTRCVRFGQEVAGIMELGMIGRGEHSEILQFVGKTVDSELSGNVIDLCPVGALTSKPFRFSARTWELVRRRSVSPHCGLGSNLTVQVKNDRVMRVLPLENEAVNECWLSDKDRFSYEALNSPERLHRPMIRDESGWREVEWPEALEFVARGLGAVCEESGPQALAALGSPHATVEELFLLRSLLQGLGSGNVDFRTRQVDFRADPLRRGLPWLGMAVTELDGLDRALVLGSSLRQDHPLLAQRLRRATRKGLRLSVLHCLQEDLLQPAEVQYVVPPSQLPRALGEILKAVSALRGMALPAWAASVAALQPGEQARQVAQSLAGGERVAVLLGNFAVAHPQAAVLQQMAHWLATALGARFGFLGEAANSVGGYLAGAVPTVDGLNAHDMFAKPRAGYVLLHAEPGLDCADPAAALAALRAAHFTVALTPFRHEGLAYAHALLPVSPFTETAGTFVSTEGRVQSFTGAVRPLGETRPGWKVLRVLGDLLGVPGLAFDGADAVLRAALPEDVASRLDNALEPGLTPQFEAPSAGIERIGTVGTYAADPLVRRAPALQARISSPALVLLHPDAMASMGITEGQPVRVSQAGESLVGLARASRAVPLGCAWVPAAVEGGLAAAASGTLRIEPLPVTAEASA